MSDSDSDDDEHNKRKVCEVGIRTGYESEQDIADNGRKPIGAAGLASKKLSTMEWFFSTMTNGKKQVVPCPYVSNDPVQLRMTRPVKMEDDFKRYYLYEPKYTVPVINAWSSYLDELMQKIRKQ